MNHLRIVPCTPALLLLPAVWAAAPDVAAQGVAEKVAGEVNLVVGAAELPGTVSVDSTYSGYGTEVLTDGRWIEEGKEVRHEQSSSDRLGNGGNTWVSASNSGREHWIRIDWSKLITVNQVQIWWSRPEWYPRAFRVEYLSGTNWVSALKRDEWFVPRTRRSVVSFAPVKVKSLRILQPPHGDGQRGIMAVQEVLAFYRQKVVLKLVGARVLSASEFRRLTPKPLAKNIAGLHGSCPGADRAVAWLSDGRVSAVGALGDGDLSSAVATPERAEWIGIRWPIRHVIDGAAIIFSGEVPECAAVGLEVHDGREWIPVQEGLSCEPKPEGRRLLYTFEPLATRAVRARLPGGRQRFPITEMEVYRYLPAAKNVWPDRLVKENRLMRQILAEEEEPSFESVSLWALSMSPAHALLGLKDTPHEVGVTWDGALVGWDTLRFRFGEAGDRLADYRDTLRRSLIDGWRPGVVVEGQIREMAVRQTAMLSCVGGDPSRPALLVRIELKNLSEEPIRTCIQVDVTSKRSGRFAFDQGCMVRGEEVVLLSKLEGRPTADRCGVRVDLVLGPGQKVRADFVHPRAATAPGEALEPYEAASFEDGLAEFKRYWDDLLAPAMQIEVPEARLNRLYKAVLTQMLINGDGNIMRYGSEPSVYSQNLYGLEEGYCMLALAFCGLHEDAQRYLDGTYLTSDFLKKVDTYEVYAHRHQQYRNGLQPHYAVSAYRFSRDDAWISKHLPLLKECAQWTISQRKTTMKLEDGAKPLHWGLLPRWSYGGDIAGLQCYPLFSNFCCWRGLCDTAWLLEQLGEADTAARYADAARDYRRVIEEVTDTIYMKDRRPPFLPLRVYGKEPVGNDYYQLFAGCVLALSPFEVGGRRARYITDFLEGSNRTFCLLPRFRRDAGPGGLDAIYGLGHVLTKLHEDSIRQFLLGFYAFLAVNMDHQTFASRETNLIYASDLHVRSEYPVPDRSDPLPCSSAVALHFLRNMLVTEELAGPGLPSGDLLLLFGVPRRWFSDGQTIRVRNAPTHFGPISLEVMSKLQAGRIEASVAGPARNPCRTIKLRLRHPEKQPIKSVLVNGKPWPEVDQKRQLVLLPGGKGPYQVVAIY